MTDLKAVAVEIAAEGYSADYVALIRMCRVVHEDATTVVIEGPAHAIEESDHSAEDGKHGFWLKRELGIVTGKQVQLQAVQRQRGAA